MNDPIELLYHRLFYEPAVYLARDAKLTESEFFSISELIAIAAQSASGSVTQHWNSLEVRAAGRLPWDVVIPPYVAVSEPDVDEQRRRLQTLSNVVDQRGYARWSVDGLAMTVDLFNPANELDLDYANAGETVVAILFAPERGPEGQNIYRAVPRPSFFELVEELANLLQPRSLIVAGRLHSNMKAIAENRMARNRSPWSLLHPGTVVKYPGAEKSRILSDVCALVRPWRKHELFIQVSKGYGGGMDREFEQVGQLLGMIPWTRYVEGSDPPPRNRHASSLELADWPTPVRANDTSPSSVELISSKNLEWQRQGVYQMQAASALLDRGYQIRAVQAPLIATGARITIPIVIVGTPNDACAYTESESWSPERVDQLKSWLEEFRRVSEARVIVVAREHSAAVTAFPDVAELIVLPCDHLPKRVV